MSKERRQIKFLAGFEGGLVPVNSLVLPQMYSSSLEVEGNLGEAPLFQFTGFFTKGGEEVYEGHIVLNNYGYEDHGDGPEPEIFIGEVRWNKEEGRWGVCDDRGEETGSDVFPVDKIIGHVYTDSKRDEEILELYAKYLLMPKATATDLNSLIYHNKWVVVIGRSIIAPHPHRHYTLKEFKLKYNESEDFRAFCSSLKLPA